MSFQSKTYQSSLFKNFKAISAGEFRQVIWYYDRHQKAILALEFEEYFEILVAYTHALFEVAEYPKHIKMADLVIETSIIENIKYVNGQEIFKTMLFRKAASHYNLFEYKKAIHVLRELLKIDPNDPENVLFLEKCLRNDNPQIVRHTQAIAILLFLISALTVSLEMLIVRNFYLDFVSEIELVRNTLFCLGVFVLLSGFIWHRWRSFSEVQKFIQEAKRNKINRKL